MNDGSLVIYKFIISYKPMHRNILVITEQIIKILSKNKELSIRQISLKVKTHRTVALRSLEFLKRIKLVKERKGDETKRGDRLFRLVKQEILNPLLEN